MLIQVLREGVKVVILLGIIYLIATFGFGWSGHLDLSLPKPEITINK